MASSDLKRGLFYGWVVVALCFAAQMFGFGTHVSFGVFFDALIVEYGWSRAQTSLLFTTSMVVFTLFSTGAGIAVDRVGARVSFPLGMALMGIGLLLSSRATALWHLIISYGMMAGLGLTLNNFGPQAGLISRWFVKRRGLALGVVFAGTGVGALIMTPTLERVISTSGWRSGYVFAAVTVLLLTPLMIIFLRDYPRQKGQQPDGMSSEQAAARPSEDIRPWTVPLIVRTPGFWLLVLSGFLTMGPLRMMTVHQIPAMIDAGFSRAGAAQIAGAAGGITAVSFIVVGWLSDRIGRQVSFAIGSISLSAAVLLISILQPGTGLLLPGLYALLYGLGEGSRSALVTAVASDLFAGKHVGMVTGAVAAAFSLGSAIYPWAAGTVFDSVGTYQPAFLIGVVSIILSVGSMWMAPRLMHNAPVVVE